MHGSTFTAPLSDIDPLPAHGSESGARFGPLVPAQFCKGMVALVVPEVMDDGIVTTKEMDKGLGSAAEAVADVAKQQLTAESAGSWAEGVVNADQRVAHFRSKAKAYSFRYAKAEADAKAREAA